MAAIGVVCLLVGGFVGYGLGQKAARSETSSAMASMGNPHDMGGMAGMGSMGGSGMGHGMSDDSAESPGPTRSMSLEDIRAAFAMMDDVQELRSIADQHLDMARDDLAAGDADGAKQKFTLSLGAYERAIELEPGQPDVLTDRGIAERGLGDSDAAIASFREAAAADPEHVQSRYNLGLVLLDDFGDAEGAKAAWEEYLEVAPNDDPNRESVEQELSTLG